MKKLKKKPKFKGTRYIAKVIQKYGGKKYKNYSQALVKARAVFAELNNEGKKIKVVSVLDKVRKHREDKISKQKPLLYYELTKEHYFFELQNFPVYINNTTNEITFVSSIFNLGVEEIPGGSRPNYGKTFSGFVNHVNKSITQKSDGYNFLVTVQPPEFNKKTKRWESEIVSIDPTGKQDDFGYTPTEVAPELEKQPKKGKEKVEKPKVEPTKSEELKIKELEQSIVKEKSRQQANEMFIKGLITKKEYKEEIERINKL